ncbi:hypothetical protein ABIB90_008182 [Bradyrhizobium sp. JR4.1]
MRALSSIATTSLPRKVNRACSAGEKREKISTIVSSGAYVPSPTARKQIYRPGLSLDRLVGRRSSRSLALTRRFGILLRKCRPTAIDAPRLVLDVAPTFSAEQNVDTAMAVATRA